MAAPSPPSVNVGDVLYLHDVRDTGFSPKQVMRWWIVIAITGYTVRLAPRSASSRGVAVPKEAMVPFTRDGHVPRTTATISMATATAARNIGQLPEPYRTQVLAQARRRRARRPGGATAT